MARNLNFGWLFFAQIRFCIFSVYPIDFVFEKQTFVVVLPKWYCQGLARRCRTFAPPRCAQYIYHGIILYNIILIYSIPRYAVLGWSNIWRSRWAGPFGAAFAAWNGAIRDADALAILAQIILIKNRHQILKVKVKLGIIRLILFSSKSLPIIVQ